MVRINIINPKYLTDQHLVAEYVEILMLLDYAKNNTPCNIPKKYCLGKGHIKFFSNKVLYLKKRHEEIKKEMKKRKFEKNKNINLKKINNKIVNDWIPINEDKKIIKKRLIEKIKSKPGFYRYYREKKETKFLINLIKKA